MEDQLIRFETAKLAKEKGFKANITDLIGESYYDVSGRLSKSTVLYLKLKYKRDNGRFIVPTQSLLQRWLRETQELSVCLHRQDKFKVEDTGRYYYFIHQIGNRICSLPNQYPTYEEALEAGLTEALKLVS